MYKRQIYEKAEVSSRESRERLIRKQEEVFHYFLRHPQYILFRFNVNCYGVLIKSEQSQMEELTENSLAHFKKVCAPEEDHLEWYVAVGTEVERLSMLPQCYKDANHYFAYRFIKPGLHVLSETTLSDVWPDREKRISAQWILCRWIRKLSAIFCHGEKIRRFTISWNPIFTTFRMP